MPGFTSSYSPLFLALFILIAAAVSWYFYRNSSLSTPFKIFLISLKALTLFLLMALFIEPVLSYLVKNDNSAIDIVLIDNSRSILTGSKQEELNSAITGGELFGGGKRVFTFSNSTGLISLKDSMLINGYSTDLSSSLAKLKENYPDRSFSSITIISDGIFNSGVNPIYEVKNMGVPIVTIALGDTLQQKDIVLSKAVYNSKSMVNTPVKIKAYLNAYGFQGTPLNVNLLREGNIISAKTVQVASEQNYEIEFDISEGTPGKIRYRLEITPLAGELTVKNNFEDFFITYLDNKINVMVLSGGPGYDNEFTGSVLKRIGNYGITYRTMKSAGEFYEGGIAPNAFGELSALFLLNFPTGVTSTALLSDIANQVKLYKTPVVFFAGKNTDYGKLAAFEEQVPFSISRPNSGEMQFSMQVVGSADNPIAKLNGLGSQQLFRNVSGIIPKPGAVTLATDKSSGEPVMISRVTADSRSAAFLGYGMWRWKLNSGTNAEKTLEEFLLASIQMSIEKEKKTRLKVHPEKDVFDYTEEVRIIAEVYDDKFLPTRNAKVTCKILDKSGSKTSELELKPDGSRFVGIIPPLVTGDYFIECSAEFTDGVYSTDKSRFLSDTVNTEYKVTRTDASVLRELANNTSGVYVEKGGYNDLNSILSKIKASKTEIASPEKTIRFDLWSNKYFLILLILLFGAEWALRKRNNIP
ncbi:MAG: hypothetical protein IAE90_15915 [Ignavibacteria bacterium]|nr:hypothetical protein [Ignavibacteria bacterium]